MMMNKYFYLLMLLLLSAYIGNAQQKDSAIKASVIRNGKRSSILYSVSGEPLTQSTVEGLLSNYPNSALELNAYRSQKRKQVAGLLICSAVAIASLVVAN